MNGIEATADGKTLMIVQSNTGKLFTVDQDGVTDEIEGATVGGDGLLLDGKTLYAVTRSPSDQIVVIQLAPDLSSGDDRRQHHQLGLLRADDDRRARQPPVCGQCAVLGAADTRYALLADAGT